MAHRTVVLLLALGTGACAERSARSLLPPPEDAPPATTELRPPTQEASPAATEPPPPRGTSSAASAVVPASAPTVDGWLADAPRTPLLHTNPLMLDPDTREGMLFGRPRGFRLDNPSRIILYRRGRGPQPRIVIARLDEGDPQGALLASSDAAGLVRGRWPSEWRPAVATRARYAAHYAEGEGIGLGDGQPRHALAAVIFVDRLGPVGVIGSWPATLPEARELVADTIRHSERCRWVVGSGCVPQSELTPSMLRNVR